MCTWKHVSTQHAFLCTCSSFIHNYYALFDPVSNSSTFLENSSFKQLTAFDSSTMKRLNQINFLLSISFPNIISKQNLSISKHPWNFDCQNSSCSSSNPLLFFSPFFFEPCQFVVLLATWLIPSLQVAVRIYRMSRVTYEWQTARCIIGLPR